MRRWVVAALLLCVAIGAPGALGQTAPKRLSDWLLEQPSAQGSYFLGLSWRVPEETVPQSLKKSELLANLSGSGLDVAVDPASLKRLREWIATLPVTGRVPVAVPDARWLQGNPTRDPVLLPGHTVVLPIRPSTVTVVTDKGERCALAHAAHLEARTYLDACMPANAWKADWAWIAQPDGRIQRFGIATWNRQEQDAPAPGAWIWAPPRDAGWPEKVSQRLIEFLATQGPAPDPDPSVPALDSVLSKNLTLRLETQLPKKSRGGEVTNSDWGTIGLLQTPTARMAPPGAFSFTFSRVNPYSRGNLFFQPFEWLEAGFRYTSISNRLYGPPELSGSQTDKDKSIDFKARLWRETAYRPEFSIGFRDIAGTGKFSGEYVVASKRTGDLDWSLGLGWGNVGGRANLHNPLSVFGKSFDSRGTTSAQGGALTFGNYFRGPTSLFGGVQYQTPWKPLLLKLEYDGNDYLHEGNDQRQRTPVNIGLVYRASRSVDVTVGVERGSAIMFGLAFHTQLDGMETPKPNDPPRVPVAPSRPTLRPDWAATSRDIATQTEWSVRQIAQQGGDLHVTIDDAEALYLRDRLDKAAAVLHRDAPASVDRFSIAYRQRGLEMVETVIDRDAWVEEHTQPVPPQRRRESVITRQVQNTMDTVPRTRLYERASDRFTAGLGFDYQQTLGGPDGFVLFQISAVERLRFNLRNDTWVQGTLRLGLIDNYDKFKYTAPSNLPRVRTFLREYVTTSALTMPNLQATHVGKLSENQFYSVYGGYLESMFAGVGAEWLYKPTSSRLALGVDINAVRQRNFEQDFGLRDYKVATGHGTVYWDTGWNDVHAKVSVGRYLAGDFGATLDMSRMFRNGVTIGAFATKTNVSAAQFGEGSFDKGIYLSIPFDAMLTKSTNSIGNFTWKPLTRDGGAMLARSNQLYSLTYMRNERTMWYEPAPRPNDALMPADRREPWTPPPTVPAPTLQTTARPSAATWESGSMLEHRLVEELYRQDFRNISVSYDDAHRLNLSLSNDTLRPISRAVGRAALTALRMSPLEAREIRITFAERVYPVVAYDFVDLPRLERFFNGSLPMADLAESVAVRYLDPSVREGNPLAMLGDLDTAWIPPRLDEALPGYRSAGRVGRDIVAAGNASTSGDWWKAGLIGSGLVIASSALDKRGLRFAQDHANSRWMKGFNQVGNILPWVGAGMVTLAALDGSDPRRSSTGFASLEAAGVAFLASTGIKYVTGRARPDAGLGSTSFKPLSSRDSFPSRHAIMSWAVATPFALEYDSNWRYGAAAIASLARVTRREHWVSDVVAGSLLGYGIGRIFWESSRAQSKGGPRAMFDLSGVSLAWDLD